MRAAIPASVSASRTSPRARWNFAFSGSATAAAACDVLFISGSEERRLPAILGELQRSAVLTVSDISQFVERGGMIQFVTVGKRVRFEINLSPAREAGLALGSELLRVASAVRGGVTPGD